MKLFDNILTEAYPNTWNWSEAFDCRHAAEYWRFSLEWRILNCCSGVTFAYSGSTQVEGNYITGIPYIIENFKSFDGLSENGLDFRRFEPRIFP